MDLRRLNTLKFLCFTLLLLLLFATGCPDKSVQLGSNVNDGGTAGGGGTGGYDSCAGKQCGDPCTICDPDDNDCVETTNEKICDADGTCGGHGGVLLDCKRDTCFPGDEPIADESGCQQDDAACYELADGSWCTGPREYVCTAEKCGPAPGAPNGTCPDGGVSGPVCELVDIGTCGWVFHECKTLDECLPGDRAIASETNCLQDDAVCYELADGSWCTGHRGNACPGPNPSTVCTDAAVCVPSACTCQGDVWTCTADCGGCQEQECDPEAPLVALCEDACPNGYKKLNGETTCECCEYEPCAGAFCGQTCSPCDPKDPGCDPVPADQYLCTYDGECIDASVVLIACPPDEACGAGSSGGNVPVCTLACDYFVHSNGQPICECCTEETPWDPCAGKSCGDECALCDPRDEDCVETADVKLCQPDATCSNGAAECH